MAKKESSMSCYITIRKKGVSLCCYNRNTEFYKALEGRPEERWTEIRIEDLDGALSNLENEMNGYKKAIRRYEKSLEFLNEAEDIHEALSSIESLEESLEELKEAFYYIKFLIDVWYQDEGQMEWIIG